MASTSGNPRRGLARRLRAGVLATMLVSALAIGGCGSISVNDSTPTSAAPPPPPSQATDSLMPSPRHDLAIMGVDFDPPLDADRIANQEPVSLIIGLSNQGNQQETEVLVTADLWDAAGTQHLLHTQQMVDSIAAGNVLPLRLTNASAPAFFSRYRLIVKVSAAAGETNLANNSRTLDILVNTAH
ncbi:MAG TPA: hypothetical protein VKY74_15495 [Chloroflexia bacterium]|nr:hypothetical protein [Chloroflexia bacterium]